MSRVWTFLLWCTMSGYRLFIRACTMHVKGGERGAGLVLPRYIAFWLHLGLLGSWQNVGSEETWILNTSFSSLSLLVSQSKACTCLSLSQYHFFMFSRHQNNLHHPWLRNDFLRGWASLREGRFRSNKRNLSHRWRQCWWQSPPGQQRLSEMDFWSTERNDSFLVPAKRCPDRPSGHTLRSLS